MTQDERESSDCDPHEVTLANTVGEAEKGERKAVETILESYLVHVRLGMAVPSAVSSYLANVIERILGGEDPRDVLALRHERRGRPLHDNFVRDLKMAAGVTALRRAGHSKEEALMEVGEKWGLSPETVKCLHRRNPVTESNRFRSVIPRETDHRFRLIPVTLAGSSEWVTGMDRNRASKGV